MWTATMSASPLPGLSLEHLGDGFAHLAKLLSVGFDPGRNFDHLAQPASLVTSTCIIHQRLRIRVGMVERIHHWHAAVC
jgi:hypothetical protein